MKPQDLPEEFKKYVMVRRDKRTYEMDGVLKNKVRDSKAQMIELPDGSLWNKADIIGIDFLKVETKDRFKSLPLDIQKRIIEQNNHKALDKQVQKAYDGNKQITKTEL